MPELKPGDLVQSRSIVGYPVGRVVEIRHERNRNPVAVVEWAVGAKTISGERRAAYELVSLVGPLQLPDRTDASAVERFLS